MKTIATIFGIIIGSVIGITTMFSILLAIGTIFFPHMQVTGLWFFALYVATCGLLNGLLLSLVHLIVKRGPAWMLVLISTFFVPLPFLSVLTADSVSRNSIAIACAMGFGAGLGAVVRFKRS